MRRRKTLSDVGRVLEEHLAYQHLEVLVDAGCDRQQLLIALNLVFLADEESWETLVGTSLRGFKKAIKEIEACAGLIERLNGTHLMYRVSIEHRDPRFVGIRESPTLPEKLREYAKNLDSLRDPYGPKRKIRAHTWKASIVAIVKESTGKDYDRQVSALIAAVLDNGDYSEKAHQAWRLKHSSAIEIMRGHFRNRCNSKGDF
jgi:hypothetical protein